MRYKRQFKKTAEILQLATTLPTQEVKQRIKGIQVPTLPPITTAPQYAAALRVQKVNHTITELPRVAPICIKQCGPQHFKVMSLEYWHMGINIVSHSQTQASSYPNTRSHMERKLHMPQLSLITHHSRQILAYAE